MGLFSSGSDDTEYSAERVAELVENAKGDTVTRERITQTSSGLLSKNIPLSNNPLIWFLDDGEQIYDLFFGNRLTVCITDSHIRVIESGEGRDLQESIPIYAFSQAKLSKYNNNCELSLTPNEQHTDLIDEMKDTSVSSVGIDEDLITVTFPDSSGTDTIEDTIEYLKMAISRTNDSSGRESQPEAKDSSEGKDPSNETETTKTDISSQQEVPSEVTTSVEEDTGKTYAEDMTSDANFCPSCGAELDEEWDFCMNCGEDVSSYNLTENTGEESSNENEFNDGENSEPNLLSELNRAEFKHQIQQLSPYEFEEFIGEIWSELGWETEITKGAQDRGIDVVAQRDNRTELIQVKRYAVDNKVGSNEIRKYATLYQQESDADSIALVTASAFTSQAEELASDLNVRAVDSDELYDYIQEKAMDIEILSETSNTGINQESSSADEFVEVYGDFTDLNQKVAEKVMMPASNAADYDGAEAAFARSGNREQLRFAIEMRNEWAEIINELEKIIPQMEGIPDKIPHAEFARLISEQIQSMRDLSEAYQRGLTYKDQLINSRFEHTPITPGELTEVEVPDAEILSEPEEDVEDLKHSQDVAMTIAAKETDKIGDFSDERRKIIESVADDLN